MLDLRELRTYMNNAKRQRYCVFDSDNDGKLYFYFRENADEILRLASIGKLIEKWADRADHSDATAVAQDAIHRYNAMAGNK